MTRRIITLTGQREAPFFREFLLTRNPDLAVFSADNLRDLRHLVESCSGQVRLLAFLTDIIVPADLLAQLTITPYNIHPGSPDYPGSHPESFAIWERAETFGVTAHEMTASVDAGAIVAVARFPVPPEAERIALADLAYARATEVFAVVAAHCAISDAPLPQMQNEIWGKPKRTRAAFQALCQSAAGRSPAELERLKRACGSNFIPPLPAQG